MEVETIETIERAKQIFDYCQSRLPIMENHTLEVEQNRIDGKSVDYGIVLSIFEGKKLIARSIGIDADDALIEIYRKLLIYYKEKSA